MHAQASDATPGGRGADSDPDPDPDADPDEWWVAARSESEAIQLARQQLKDTPGVDEGIRLTAQQDEDVLDTWFSSVRDCRA